MPTGFLGVAHRAGLASVASSESNYMTFLRNIHSKFLEYFTPLLLAFSKPTIRKLL
jgi:hypothetical protein